MKIQLSVLLFVAFALVAAEPPRNGFNRFRGADAYGVPTDSFATPPPSGPYPPSGWKPAGRRLLLPGEVRSDQGPIDSQFGTGPSGGGIDSQYGPSVDNSFPSNNYIPGTGFSSSNGGNGFSNGNGNGHNGNGNGFSNGNGHNGNGHNGNGHNGNGHNGNGHNGNGHNGNGHNGNGHNGNGNGFSNGNGHNGNGHNGNGNGFSNGNGHNGNGHNGNGNGFSNGNGHNGNGHNGNGLNGNGHNGNGHNGNGLNGNGHNGNGHNGNGQNGNGNGFTNGNGNGNGLGVTYGNGFNPNGQNGNGITNGGNGGTNGITGIVGTNGILTAQNPDLTYPFVQVSVPATVAAVSPGTVTGAGSVYPVLTVPDQSQGGIYTSLPSGAAFAPHPLTHTVAIPSLHTSYGTADNGIYSFAQISSAPSFGGAYATILGQGSGSLLNGFGPYSILSNGLSYKSSHLGLKSGLSNLNVQYAVGHPIYKTGGVPLGVF